MPSELETAMQSLITVFHNYASKGGNSGTLNRAELRLLMENELSNFLRVRKGPIRPLTYIPPHICIDKKLLLPNTQQKIH